ncbi:MAG: hypothetical protein HOQ12_07560, partial [Gemmatimonadaceae bacterium]|nr:hypothetical protein [Gemmatimonadaceae bacterium]
DAPSSGAASGTGDASGTGGAGPGSGGGIGSGVGTGIGSANGPGTGGGADTLYPPYPMTLPQPPQPVPKNVKLIVFDFDVDSTGRVVGVRFTETPDGGYNKKLREVMSRFRFRPATRADGTPVRANFHGSWSF